MNPDLGYHQRWRGPLRLALNDLRSFARASTKALHRNCFRDPDAALVGYGSIVRERSLAVRDQWFKTHLCSPSDRQEAEQLLRLETHLLAMYTSCGWFFDDITGIEAEQNLRHAACAIGLLHTLTGADFGPAFQQRLSAIPANTETSKLMNDVRCWLRAEAPGREELTPLHLRRRAGTVLHLSALPGPGPIGDLGSVPMMADWMSEAGLEVWQILPCSPCGFGNSPYSSWSTFSGNPWFIDMNELHQVGLLPDYECPVATSDVHFDVVEGWKMDLLERAAARFLMQEDHPWRSAYRAFRERADWVEPASLFWALKRKYNGKPWWEWPKAVRERQPVAVKHAKSELASDMTIWAVLEFFVDRQWRNSRAYLAGRGINLLGDIPIYVGEDSVDVWANPTLFQLGADRRPTRVAGCPPDAYCEEGQRWGQPTV